MQKAVLLAGGVGSRLWPLSRQLYPKQLLSIYGDESLLQATLRRVCRMGIESCVIVASHDHRFYIREQIMEMGLPASFSVEIILEPCARNTAPAIALAAYESAKDDVLCVFPADHYLQENQLVTHLALAKQFAEQGQLVTFGVMPQAAETGYGYVELGERLAPGVHQVKSFVEKPTRAVAERYLNSGHYWWNSGMFCFQAGAYLTELQRHRPDIVTAVEATWKSRYRDLGFVKYAVESFSSSPSESVDYAVMEHTDRAVVVSLTDAWSDVGSWQAVHQLQEQDAAGNVASGDVIALSTSNSLVYSTSRLVATVGLDDMVVVETPDAVLVAKRDQDQQIKHVVSQLQARGRDEHYASAVIRRPWGHYRVMEKTAEYEVRRVVIQPGQRIGPHTYQDCQHQWTVLSGRVNVELDGVITALAAGATINALSLCSFSLFAEGDEAAIVLEVKASVTVTAGV